MIIILKTGRKYHNNKLTKNFNTDKYDDTVTVNYFETTNRVKNIFLLVWTHVQLFEGRAFTTPPPPLLYYA